MGTMLGLGKPSPLFFGCDHKFLKRSDWCTFIQLSLRPSRSADAEPYGEVKHSFNTDVARAGIARLLAFVTFGGLMQACLVERRD